MEKIPEIAKQEKTTNKEIKPIYAALFVENISSLLSIFPPKHKKVSAHHSTISFRPKSLDGIRIGEKIKLKIIGRCFDEKGDALLVDNPRSTNENPHITLSLADDVSPIYSNELIKKAKETGGIEYFDPPIEIDVTEGYFDGKKDIIGE